MLPKGHIEPTDADAAAAALRELGEEAGVAGEVLQQLRDVEYTTGAKRVRVSYFLVRATGPVPQSERRATRWLPFSDALRTLSFAEARNTLAAAEQLLAPLLLAFEDTQRRREFLLEDYKHWADAYFKNEEAGERRVQFLVGIVTAVLGALGFLCSTDDGVDIAKLTKMAPPVLVALLAFGIVTLMRIVRRNVVTDGHLHALKKIRKALGPQWLVAELHAKHPKPGRAFTGGLAQTVSLMNAGFIGGALWPVLAGLPHPSLRPWALMIILLLSWLAQVYVLVPCLTRYNER